MKQWDLWLVSLVNLLHFGDLYVRRSLIDWLAMNENTPRSPAAGVASASNTNRCRSAAAHSNSRQQPVCHQFLLHSHAISSMHAQAKTGNSGPSAQLCRVYCVRVMKILCRCGITCNRCQYETIKCMLGGTSKSLKCSADHFGHRRKSIRSSAVDATSSSANGGAKDGRLTVVFFFKYWRY